MRNVEHVWVDLGDGAGEFLSHAVSEPADAGEGKRDVTDQYGRLVKDLERHNKDDGRRGWRPVDGQ